MRSPWVKLQLGLLTALVFALVSAAQAQQYLYTNDNVANKTNSTTALKVNAAGKAAVIKTYSTAGKSSGGSSYYASEPIVSAVTSKNSCLFVSNGGDSTIAAFKIDTTSGKLAAVKGSPFSYGVTGAQPFGISLAVANNQFLFAGNSKDNSISVLSIAATCSLKGSSSVNLSFSPVDIKATPNGKYLIASYMGPIDSFSIDASKGTLTELGPFSSSGSAAGLDITCDGATVFFGDAATHTEVEAYRIESDGKLNELGNFTNGKGSNSNNVLLSKDQKKLYVTNNLSNQISVLAVNHNGVQFFESITTLTSPGQFSAGLAENKAGTQVYVSEAKNPESIGVLTAKGFSVKEVKGSPFGVVPNGFAPAGLIAFPAFSCK
jgi:6-phosphogluconolactonase (cycloisomerase 2 family)